MTIVKFDRPHRPHRNREEVGEALRRSLDLNDLAARWRYAAVALYAAAADVDRAHTIPGTIPPWEALEHARRAAADVFAAVDEFMGNAALAEARAESGGDEPLPTQSATTGA